MLRLDDGTRIAYRTIGTGPLGVVLVHGWMVSGAVFDALLESFDTTGLRVVVPDLRGSGGSDKPAAGYSLDRYARDILAIADDAKLPRFTLIGHSMGGQIAQLVAALNPDRVRGAALLCPVPACGIPLPEEARGLFRGSAGNRAAQQTILDMACKELAAADRERLLDDACRVAPACIEGAFDAWTAGGFKDKLGAIRARTLVVATDDPFTKPDFLKEEVLKPIAGARLAVLPGPGHYPQIERRRETAAILQAFLAGLGASD